MKEVHLIGTMSKQRRAEVREGDKSRIEELEEEEEVQQQQLLQKVSRQL
jgi:hypothetical protein